MLNSFLLYNQEKILLDSDLFEKFYSLSKRYVPVFLFDKNLCIYVHESKNIEIENYNVIQREINNDFFNEKIILIKNYSKWKEEKNFSKDAPTRSIVDFILIEAVLQKASDIHFNIIDFNIYDVKFKKNTILYDFCLLSKEQFDSILLCFKILSSIDPSKKQIPQSSSFEKIFKGEVLDFRFSTHPTFLGERFVIRILSKKNVINYKLMMFSKEVEDVIEKIIKAPSGLAVFTGPTNSGKTTLIHSILTEIAKQNVNIMTLEDPVEYRVPGIIQTNISEHGLNFFEGMKSILRQDPDVIFLGEIRDEKLAKIAIQAALTGHKVLTTLHAYSNKGAITRLFDMNISNALLSECILSVFSQRLIRKHDDSGLLNIVDACFFSEEIKKEIRKGSYDCVVDNLRQNVEKYLTDGLVSVAEVERVFGI